jgi:hypothetical protein
MKAFLAVMVAFFTGVGSALAVSYDDCDDYGIVDYINHNLPILKSRYEKEFSE